MRQLQEIVQKAELVHRFEGRRMDRVAAKIAQKICMFFENDRIDAGAGKEKPEHHPGRSAADDAAAAGECLWSLVHSPPSKEAHRSTMRRYFASPISARGEPKHCANENCNGNVPSG